MQEVLPYNDYSSWTRRTFPYRVQKISIDAGFSCPNRDGKVSSGGCSFCDNNTFNPSYCDAKKTVTQQLEEGKAFFGRKYPEMKYLAYFQAYSNTFGPVERLRKVYGEALAHPDVVGIVVGTRPDCIDNEKLDLLQELKDNGHIVQIEYGVESCYDSTLEHINRGHDFACAARAIEMTAARGFDVCAHFILGLPFETRQMLLDQCSLINSLPLHSVKFHQLQLVKGTAMAAEAKEHPERFLQWTLDEYLDLIVDILERLRPDLYIERVAGEVPPRFVEETRWDLIRNFQILHLLDERLEQRDTRQGALLDYGKETLSPDATESMQGCSDL